MILTQQRALNPHSLLCSHTCDVHSIKIWFSLLSTQRCSENHHSPSVHDSRAPTLSRSRRMPMDLTHLSLFSHTLTQKLRFVSLLRSSHDASVRRRPTLINYSQRGRTRWRATTKSKRKRIPHLVFGKFSPFSRSNPLKNITIARIGHRATFYDTFPPVLRHFSLDNYPKIEASGHTTFNTSKRERFFAVLSDSTQQLRTAGRISPGFGEYGWVIFFSLVA